MFSIGILTLIFFGLGLFSFFIAALVKPESEKNFIVGIGGVCLGLAIVIFIIGNSINLIS